MPSERERALAILRAHGADATSFQLLEPGYAYHFDEDGFVAYVDTGTAWVAGGGPVAEPARVAALARSFIAAASRAERRASFFGVGQAFCDATSLRHVRVGEQPWFSPARWETNLASHASLRYQLRRAERRGVRVRRLGPDEIREGAPARERVDRLARAWVEAKSLAPMGFLVELSLWDAPDERIYLVAEEGDRLVGFLAAVPVYARNGWLVEDLLRDRHAPNGTAELLVDRVMRIAAERGADVVTLGLAPLAGAVPRRLRAIRAVTSALFDFHGLHAFKAKLRPDGWEPIFVADAESPWIALADGLTAFARGSMLRFAAQTLARGPRAALVALTALLALWIPALALAPTRRYFPSPWIQHAWVAFDVALAVGLLVLCRRYRSWLAEALAAAVTVDALLTLGEALAWNVPHLRSLVDAGVVGAACVGPAVGALVLRGMARRGRHLDS